MLNGKDLELQQMLRKGDVLRQEGPNGRSGPWGQAEHTARKGRYFRQEETHGGEKAQGAYGWALGEG